jgi:uncharacterized pyridoxal phosphate-containing UPF0001 family protein
VAELISGLRVERIRANLVEIREQIDAATRRSPVTRSAQASNGVELLAAVKYVEAHGGLFEWDFIGQLQSRRVKEIVPYVRLIHSVASDSALRELERHRAIARADLRILIEVNVAGEAGKAGVAPDRLEQFIAGSPLPVAGLMTMPPLAHEPDASRRWFAALRELAEQHELEHLSMGTSQDYVVAVEEGATIVRIGTRLYT